MKRCFYEGDLERAGLIGNILSHNMLAKEEYKGFKYIKRQLLVQKVIKKIRKNFGS